MKFEVQGSNKDVIEFKIRWGISMKIMNEKKYNHIELNNEVTKRKDNGFFNLEKDQEALAVYLEEIHDKTIYFDSEIERLHYLVDNNFILMSLTNIAKKI